MVFGLEGLYSYSTLPTSLILIAVIWSLIWKGLALWKSAHKNSTTWFIVLLIVNTLGILEILYIFIFSKISINRSPKKVVRRISKKIPKKTKKPKRKR